MKVSSALRHAQEILSKIEDEDYAKWEALLILAYILKVAPLQVYLYLDKEISEEKFFKILKERQNKKPLPYILKEVYFWGRKFHIEEGVLIPRQDTEILIQAFLDLNIKKGRILELGIGSGIISITLLLERPEIQAFGIDINFKALKLSRKNALEYKVEKRLSLIKGNWFNPIGERCKFKVIISNPPYLSEKEWKDLEKEVKFFEPKEALIAGEKGTEYQEMLLKKSHDYLENNGFLIFEMGYNQSEEIQGLLKKYNWKYKFHRDLRNYKRVVVAWKESI
ncbi:peptide chain release factor N(5)-glutamine methyltransferase [Thermodesulfobacterium hydrogeniphilum]|uniref:peptide chain release factor N(5)-glutamine methyltransferase n=1 Tax=Thermodesulfobacterium hydrogeniphilum TaxID=161156 RepID=UPI00056F8FF8|nr:peptide chain release factor N(5)-glutamine methyltransferase [Thermodesulfobacterium hydrogeniphilum]